jgi:hypothetical protein
VLDLFSGIGGFSLGLERTGGFKTVAFCEIEPFCRASWRNTGLRCPATMTSETSQPNVSEQMELPLMSSVEGSPAKTSAAPERAWLDGERSGLWSEYSRLIREIRPQLVIVENVAALLDRGLGPFSETWPASGTMRSGRCFGVLRGCATHATASVHCGLPQRRAWTAAGFGIPLHDRTGRYKKTTVLRVHALVGEHGWRIHPNFTEALMGFPWNGPQSSHRKRRRPGHTGNHSGGGLHMTACSVSASGWRNTYDRASTGRSIACHRRAGCSVQTSTLRCFTRRRPAYGKRRTRLSNIFGGEKTGMRIRRAIAMMLIRLATGVTWLAVKAAGPVPKAPERAGPPTPRRIS